MCFCSAKEPYNQWLFCKKIPETWDILWVFATHLVRKLDAGSVSDWRRVFAHLVFSLSLPLFPSLFLCIENLSLTCSDKQKNMKNAHAKSTWKTRGWRRVVGCILFMDYFPQKSPIISGSFAKNDLKLETSWSALHGTRSGVYNMAKSHRMP